MTIHIYAVMLLGHFKEVKAHKVIVDMFSIPGELTDQIFGDIKTSNLPVILLNTCGGSVDLIKSMILNEEVNRKGGGRDPDFAGSGALVEAGCLLYNGVVSGIAFEVWFKPDNVPAIGINRR